MGDSSSVERLANLAERRQNALSDLGKKTQAAEAVLANMKPIQDVQAAAERHQESIAHIRALADSLQGPRVALPKTPSMAEVLAEMDAEAEAAAEAFAQERRDAVEREEAMLDVLRATQAGIDGIHEVLREQQADAGHNDRLQRAIFAVTVLGFIGAISLGVSGVWWSRVIAGLLAFSLSVAVLWQTGLLRRRAGS